jgi:hypothetical protein
VRFIPRQLPIRRLRRKLSGNGNVYVGAPISPVRPGFKYVSFSASWHSAWLFPDPIGPENPLNRAADS